MLIKNSYGDALLNFGQVVDNYLKPKDISFDQIFFSIKQNIADATPLLKKLCQVVDGVNGRFYTEITSTDMKTLSIGRYYYDIVCIQPNGNQFTADEGELQITKGVYI